MQIFKNMIVEGIKFHEDINFYWGYIATAINSMGLWKQEA